eukprot:TRINITY_DN2005_c0_g1_i1.p1 TRINITY_DN2005_c0_g1~~TRINITY_DN2005_c0_g1_i1.p1  ORF type:complete len:276 (-),score=49.73 TRINITY_DN2005_c0_g1_i1:78-905(-)
MAEEVINKVLIVVAMTHEANAIIEHLKLTKMEPSKYDIGAPLCPYHGLLDTSEVLLLINGPRAVHNMDGTVRCLNNERVNVEGVSVVPAAISTWEGIKRFKPHIVINAGTAGGIRAKGAHKGSVYLVQSPIRYHDRLINFRLPGDEFEVNNYQAYGIGNYVPTPSPNLSKQFNIPYGVLSTGSSFDPSEGNIAKQLEANGASLKDMEGATVAEIAQMCGVHYLIVKGVTDYIDGQPEEGSHSEQFKEHLEPVSETVAKTVTKIVQWIVGKKYSDL